MYELVYQSVASTEFLKQQLEALVQEIRPFNAQNEITGLLVFDGKTFLQILEGDKETIENLYQRICQDDRHTDVNSRWAQTCEKRTFSDWEMGCYALEGASISEDLVLETRIGNDLDDGRSHGAKLFRILSEQLYPASKPILTSDLPNTTI